MAGLEELRRLRKEKKTRASTLNFDDDEAEFYQELDDAEYRQLQRERLREDDFVVDDNGAGYVDNGQDEWEQRGHYDSDEDQEAKREAKRRKTLVKPKKTEPTTSVGALFRKAHAQSASNNAQSSGSVVRPKGDSAELDNLINGLGSSKRASSLVTGRATPRFGGLNGGSSSILSRGLSSSTPIRSVNRGLFASGLEGSSTPTPISRIGNFSRSNLSMDMPDSSFDLGDDSIDAGDMSIDQPVTSEETQAPVSSASRNLTPPEEEGESSVNITHEDADTSNLSNYSMDESLEPLLQTPTPAQSEDDVLGTGMYGSTEWRYNLVSEPAGGDSSEIANGSGPLPAGDSGKLKFYWTDYEEVGGHTLILFGRTESQSVTLAIKGMKRDVFYLPCQGSTPQDVLAEVQPKLTKMGVTEIISRPITKKYCFGMPGVPKEAEYLEVLIPYPHEPPKNEGRSFSKVFGSNTPLIETFLISRNIMGPCWLEVENCKVMPKVAWTKVEMEVDSASSVSADKEQAAPPPMTVMSLSLRTKFVDNHHEIVAITARFFQNIKHDTTTNSTQLKSTLITGVRPIDGVFPSGFKTLAEQHNTKASANGIKKILWEHTTEKALVSWFMAKLGMMDPDIIVGHGVTQTHLAILLKRALDLNERLWSRLGRRRLNNKPKAVTAFTVQEVCSGRLICDLNNTMGHELTQAKCSEFTLDEMCDVYLGQKRQPYDCNVQSTPWLGLGAEGLLKIIQHSELDTLYTTSLVIKLQMLPLTRQLTQLAGNAWARTLAGTRSGRNDFLLLHEFTQKGYIVPDNVEREGGPVVNDRGVKYQGGAVFEPEKGLYRSNVLVMDFNSLYPSLIQEYNICFSTIDLAQFADKEEGDDLPEVPSPEVPQGVLPEVIHRLVDRRRQVKRLMKDKDATPEKLAEWEIRQQALKLTANSMYGCLGLSNSRFAARKLAMLVTAKGRETLHHTRSLAEKQNLRVLYGDTDSVMIEAGVKDYNQTIKIGTAFKKMVNDQYRQMELDIDNVFSAILLYAKKKYAAMNLVDGPDGTHVAELQVKGLDLKRREFCQLCKEASRRILEILFNGEDEDVFEVDVIPFLTDLTKRMREGKIALGKYIIRNQLNKDPSAYTDKRMPQLTVANARIAAGDVVKAKDVIPYIISSGNGAPYERAVSVSTLKAKGLEPDIDYYLDHQLFAPLDRLCMYVPGYDRVRLGEALGLDKKKLSTGSSNGHQDLSVKPLETTMTNAERFKDCEVLTVTGPCGHEFSYTGLSDANLTSKGLRCPGCSGSVSWNSVAATASAAARSAIRKYYLGWLACSENDCGLLTRHISGYGRRCPRNRCRGHMSFVYSDRALYNQLSYLLSLFDAEPATEDTKQKVIAQQNADGLMIGQTCMQGYLNSCGRRFVDMAKLFPKPHQSKVTAE